MSADSCKVTHNLTRPAHSLSVAKAILSGCSFSRSRSTRVRPCSQMNCSLLMGPGRSCLVGARLHLIHAWRKAAWARRGVSAEPARGSGQRDAQRGMMQLTSPTRRKAPEMRRDCNWPSKDLKMGCRWRERGQLRRVVERQQRAHFFLLAHGGHLLRLLVRRLLRLLALLAQLDAARDDGRPGREEGGEEGSGLHMRVTSSVSAHREEPERIA